MPAPSAPSDASSEVQRLQDLVSQMRAHGETVFTGRVKGMSLMPNSIPADLSIWLEERHAEMHDALMNGETTRVSELSSRLSEGAERLMEITGGLCS